MASLTFLFDVKFGNSYAHIWTTGSILFAPLFAASMVPADFEIPFTLSAQPELTEKAVSRVLNLALVPLMLIYSVVLHAYAVRLRSSAPCPRGR